jgi:hypothetical protein
MMNIPKAAAAPPLSGAPYASVADMLLHGLGRAFQRVTRRPAPPSFFYAALVLLLLNLLIFLVLAVSFPLAHTISGSDRLVIAAGAASLPLVTVVVLLTTRLHAAFISTVRSQIEPALVTDDDKQSLARWLAVNLGMPRQLGLILVFGGVCGPLSIVIARSALAFDVSTSTLLVAILCGIQGAIYLPTFVMVLALPFQLGRYFLTLRTVDPANSNLIICLHIVLITNIFFLGVFAALVALWLWSFGLLSPQTAVILVGMQWIIIVSTFLIGQYGLAQIIRRAKQHKLNEIQSRIAQIEQESNLATKDSVETILRLLDYYGQVKGMRGSALDVSAVLSFLQSLLLPLIASLLANITTIMQLVKP